MPTINATARACNTCKPNDGTEPPQPRIITAAAFARAKELRSRGTGSSGPVSAKADPCYFEFGNVEAGTTIELINLSKNPEADFNSKKDVVELTITGRDIRNRTASVYMTNKQMDKIDLQAGDQFRVRVVDAEGNASLPTTGELEPNDWANLSVQPHNARTGWHGEVSRGGQFDMLDGEGVRKTLLVRAVADGRPPLLLEDKLRLTSDSFSSAQRAAAQTILDNKDAIIAHGGQRWSRDEVVAMASCEELSTAARKAFVKIGKKQADFDKFDTNGDGQLSIDEVQKIAQGELNVTLVADRAVEPHARVEVFNTRTGKTVAADIGEDQKINIALEGTAEGDTLIVRPFDNEGVAGKELEMRFSARCDDGRAKTINVLGARLSGVI